MQKKIFKNLKKIRAIGTLTIPRLTTNIRVVFRKFVKSRFSMQRTYFPSPLALW